MTKSSPSKLWPLGVRSCLFFLNSILLSPHNMAVSSDSIPYYSPQRDASFEEYDFLLLDPTSATGAPLGGFSRATRSRLAALPLFLPDVVNEVSEEKTEDAQQEEAEYLEVTDDKGQKFICRTYQEDELTASSLEESMFHVPQMRDQESADKGESASNEDSSAGQTNKARAASTASGTRFATAASSSEASVDANGNTIIGGMDANGNTIIGEAEMDNLMASDPTILIKTLSVTDQLKDHCAQIHKGWWSYEWCFEKTISQFHVQVDKRGAQVRVEDLSTLGRFHTYTVQVMTPDLQKKKPNKYLDDKFERARIVQKYTDGEYCDETGQQRQAVVDIQCCSERTMEKSKGLLHRNGLRVDTNIASVISITENPTCSYHLTICTPLLCEDEDSRRKSPFGGATPGKSLLKAIVNEAQQQKEQELQQAEEQKKKAQLITPKSTIREILDIAMNGHCLQSDTGGWWTYEFCHGGKIRQYHEAIGTRKTATGNTVMTKRLETEHVLGQYDPVTSEAFPGEDWRFVVNVTKASKTHPSSSAAMSGPGNGAYFELEYTRGDVCDHSDVTDSAVVAGSTGGAGQGIARAASVRYSCGSEYNMLVNEDSTCHYVVVVTLPELCELPLFQAPITKKRVVKCLPVD